MKQDAQSSRVPTRSPLPPAKINKWRDAATAAIVIPQQSSGGEDGPAGVNITRLLLNPAWAIVPPPLLDVIKDFSRPTKRAEGTNALAPSPPVGEAMTRRLGAGAGKTQGKLGSMLIQLISQRGWQAGGVGGGAVCVQIFRPRKEVAEKELGHASSRYCSAFIGN